VGLFSSRTGEEREAARHLADVFDMASFEIRRLGEQSRSCDDLAEYLGLINGEMLIAVEKVALLPPSGYRQKLGHRAVLQAATVHAHCLTAAESGGVSRDRLHEATQRNADESASRQGLTRPDPHLIESLTYGS
jgi:hypothetical protein